MRVDPSAEIAAGDRGDVIPHFRVGLVGPLPPPEGGMANQTNQLVNFLTREGVTVSVVRTNPPYQSKLIASTKGLRAIARLIPYISQLWRMCATVNVVHVMANSGWSWHLFAAPALWIAHLRGIPVVINYRGGEADAFLRRSIGVIRPTLTRASAIVVPSGFLEHVFETHGFNTTVIPNIIDLERFSDNAGASSHEQMDAEPHVVVTRNLEPIYDNATAIRAIHRLRESIPNIRMTIAGVGPQQQELVQLVKTLELTDAIDFVGRLDNNDIATLYRRADLMINPSLADNMPISVLESMASGVPIVSTNVGGVPYLLENGVTARLVPPGDPSQMADAIRELLSDSLLRERVVKAAYAKVQEFSWTQIKGRWLHLYYNLARL